MNFYSICVIIFFMVLKRILFLFFILSVFFSCSNSNVSDISEIKENLFTKTNKEQSKNLWTRELESVRLVQKIDEDAKVLSTIKLTPEVINVSEIEFTDVYPFLDGFGSLNLSEIDENLLNFINESAKNIQYFTLEKLKYENTSKQSVVFFMNDLKENYSVKFNQKFPELSEEVQNSENAVKVFSSYLIGEPIVDEKNIIVPIRFFNEKKFVDIQFYINSNSELKISLITILNWSEDLK